MAINKEIVKLLMACILHPTTSNTSNYTTLRGRNARASLQTQLLIYKHINYPRPFASLASVAGGAGSPLPPTNGTSARPVSSRAVRYY